MKLTRIALAALSALTMLVLAPSANAGSWTGCYVGVQGGYAMAVHEIGIPGLGSLDGLGGEGFEGGPAIGCDLQVVDRFVVGAFADYAFRNVDTSLSALGTSVSVGLDDAWSIGGRAGVLITPTTLIYGLIAYQHSDFDDAGSGILSDMAGVAGGGGIEAEFAPGWAVRTEYRYVSYDTENLGGVVNLDTTEHQARVGIVYRFWSGAEPTAPLKILP